MDPHQRPHHRTQTVAYYPHPFVDNCGVSKLKIDEIINLILDFLTLNYSCNIFVSARIQWCWTCPLCFCKTLKLHRQTYSL